MVVDPKAVKRIDLKTRTARGDGEIDEEEGLLDTVADDGAVDDGDGGDQEVRWWESQSLLLFALR